MARPDEQEPVLVNDNDPRGQTYEHPAYAQIAVFRTSGHATLYDSDFRHHNTMRISIHCSQLKRDIGRDWHFPREEYIEVELSEAQWATFVSSPNAGSGVPCTLRQLQGRSIPKLPAPKSRVEQFGKEHDAKLAGVLERLNKIEELIDNSKLSQKDKNAMKSELRIAHMDLTVNREFMGEQFGEHMEKVVERAKTEVNAYQTQMVSKLGMQALAVMQESSANVPTVFIEYSGEDHEHSND